MSWRDQLRKASFRGAAFFVDSAEATIGRRTVTHEYPLRDKPYVEDLGRKARSFTVEAYVLGADYMTARDALARAIEEPGPGKLVHPYRGELTVAITEARLKESTAEGGMARFTLTCVEAGENTFPTSEVSTRSLVDSKATAAVVIAERDFENVFSVDNRPSFVSDAAGSLLTRALDGIKALTGAVPTVPGGLSDLLPQLSNTQGQLGALMRSPLPLAQKITSLIGGLLGIVRDPLAFATGGLSTEPAPLAAIKLLRGLFDFGANDNPVPRTTANRIAQSDNQRAVTQLVQRTAVIEASRASSRAEFASYQEAVAVRTELADKLDELAADTTDDAVYQSLVDLRQATVKDITTRGADLARVTIFRPRTTLPALVVAYDLYDDPAREADIVARNHIAHPGFVQGGRAIEVLTDA